MPKHLDFNSEEFLQLPPKDKILRCTQLAERAKQMAQTAPVEHKRYFLDIAEQWRMLADAMRAIAER